VKLADTVILADFALTDSANLVLSSIVKYALNASLTRRLIIRQNYASVMLISINKVHFVFRALTDVLIARALFTNVKNVKKRLSIAQKDFA
jgi:hypothetical protein